MKNSIIMLAKCISVITFISGLFSEINYSEDISPIIYQNCTECHRNGEIGAFLPLTNFNEVYNNRNWIAYSISVEDEHRHGEPIMPPWPPDREFSSLYGERYLTDEDVDLFFEWIEYGGLQGDPNLEFPIPDFPDGSSIGEPDIVLEMEESVQIQGNYQDYYRCFIFELNSEEDIFYSAMEVRPGNNEAVHHSVIVAVPPGSADWLDNQDDEYGYECFGSFGVQQSTDLLGGYAPGTKPIKWGNGLAQRIPQGWDLVVQMHYAPVWDDMEDQTSVNIFLVDNEDVEREIESFTMIDPSISLPPYEITEVYNTIYVSSDISILSFFPHSHLLGKTWELYATTAQNDTIPFIKINNWNFDWQNFYYPEYMLHIPSGSTIHAIATYDNTPDNPNNPNNPPEHVGWGDGTTDEMFFLPISYVPYNEGDEYLSVGNIENIPGDVNFDNQLDVVDIVLIVGFILNTQEFTSNQISASDLNSDGSVDVMDVILIVSEIISE